MSPATHSRTIIGAREAPRTPGRSQIGFDELLKIGAMSQQVVAALKAKALA
jgi:hypothetical protein